MDLFVSGEGEVGTKTTVAVVTKQHNTRLLCLWVEHVEVGRVPAGVDRDAKVKVGQDAVVAIVERL